ncbi:MAG: O-methyltransferase [Flavobacteriaceae bacterium]
MQLNAQTLADYAEKHSGDEPPLLVQLRRATHQKILQPRMLSGALQGRLLALLAQLKQPKSILEVGTFTGYATLCLAEGLAADGSLDTIDKNEELSDFQRFYFDQSPFGKQIVQHLGDALEIIPKLAGPFDLVFLDADKKNYLNYLELLLPKMNSGALLITDNVLWSGKVLSKPDPKDLDTIVLAQYNQRIASDPRLETVMLPFRDGISVSRLR